MLSVHSRSLFFFFNDTATTEIYTLSLHDALPISMPGDIAVFAKANFRNSSTAFGIKRTDRRAHLYILGKTGTRSEEHTSELQSRQYLVCRLLLEKKERKSTRLNSKSRQ